MNTSNRWLIASAGALMQVAFGAVYARSVFRIPLSQAHAWTIAEVTRSKSPSSYWARYSPADLIGTEAAAEFVDAVVMVRFHPPVAAHGGATVMPNTVDGAERAAPGGVRGRSPLWTGRHVGGHGAHFDDPLFDVRRGRWGWGLAWDTLCLSSRWSDGFPISAPPPRFRPAPEQGHPKRGSSAIQSGASPVSKPSCNVYCALLSGHMLDSVFFL